MTNALISNNSWTYVGDNSYDLAAASYDAAVRDALPLVTGSQPVLFVFAAGNDGGGDDGGGGGDPDTILSPGTAKNVITVGALEQLRNITNTYTPLDSSNQVAAWSAGTIQQLSGGRLFGARQRGHRHGRGVRAVQAGRGCARLVCGLDTFARVGYERLLQSDE